MKTKIILLAFLILLNVWQYSEAAISINKENNFTKFTYGKSIPEISCAPLQACDLTLQEAERISGIYLGDTERWMYEVATSGGEAKTQQHIIFKPQENHIVTNLIITTDKRTYHVKLISNDNNHLFQAEFDYPDDNNHVQSEGDEVSLIQMNLEHIDFNYQIKFKSFLKQKPDFYPLKVFNDGLHVYIIMPEEAKVHEAPALFLQEGGELMLVNYRVKKNYYIVDQLFNKAVLVHGVGRDQIKIEINYQR